MMDRKLIRKLTADMNSWGLHGSVKPSKQPLRMRLNRNEVVTWAFGLSPGVVMRKLSFSNSRLPALGLLKGWTTSLGHRSLTIAAVRPSYEGKGGTRV